VTNSPIELDPRLRPTISVSEAAVVLGISEQTLYLAIRAGQFPAVRVRKRIRISTAGLLKMLETPGGIGIDTGASA
jgi:excisionase family DNA binding protein